MIIFGGNRRITSSIQQFFNVYLIKFLDRFLMINADLKLTFSLPLENLYYVTIYEFL